MKKEAVVVTRGDGDGGVSSGGDGRQDRSKDSFLTAFIYPSQGC